VVAAIPPAAGPACKLERAPTAANIPPTPPQRWSYATPGRWREPLPTVTTRPSAIPAGIRAVSEQTESGGVFGSLPRSRPGTRSPLRDPDEATRRSATPDGPETSEEIPRAEAEPQAPSSEDEWDQEASAQDREDSGGLEDLAWAGIAAAAEAATIGVRLASRAMEAVKDAGKRT
jgi:hypothetical protein